MINPFPTIITLCVLFIFSLSTASATPEYSIEYGQSCALCHANPGGGGIKTLYGTQFFSQSDLSASPVPFESIEDFSPMLNERIQVGFDFRTLGYLVEKERQSGNENSFFTMEGALYLAFAINDKTRFVYEKGLRNTFEAYALFNNFIGKLSLKAGRFTPSYGWYFSDHNSFVRNYTGHGLYSEDDGIELSYHSDNNDLSITFSNASNSSLLDTDYGKGLITRYARRISISDNNLVLGGSWEYRQIGLPNPSIRQGNLFYGFAGYSLVFLGEVDYRRTNTSALISSNRLRLNVGQGYYPYVGYDFFDPDIDVKNGITDKYSLGLEIFPFSHLSYAPAIEYQTSNNQSFTTIYLQLHLWY